MGNVEAKTLAEGFAVAAGTGGNEWAKGDAGRSGTERGMSKKRTKKESDCLPPSCIGSML